MHDVNISGFGLWQVTVDGATAAPLHSRVGRELLLRMSEADGQVGRDRLVTDLGLDEAVGGSARRRLTQELSRLQRSLDIPLWTGSREWIGVHPDCVLTSDLNEFLTGARAQASLPADADELSRLLLALRLPDRGQLLAGHSSEWVIGRRNEVAHAEVGQLKRVVQLAGERDPESALRCASRWASLEPYNNEAHEATVRLLVRLRGSDVSETYVDDLGRRYREELGLPVDERIRRLLVEDVAPADVGWSDLDRLEQTARSARAAGATDDEVADRLRAVDDHLRLTGLQNRRSANLDALATVSGDPIDLAWRRSDALLAGVGDQSTADLVRAHQPLDLSIESQAMLAITSCRHQEATEEAMMVLRSIVDQATSPLVLAEAGLALAHVHDQMHEIASAEEVLLQACAEAEEHGLPFHRARALVALGVNRTRHGDALQAERYLNEARQSSRVIGAESIGAAAQYGFALFNYHQLRVGSSLRHSMAASEAAERQGDLRVEAYYRAGVAVAANAIGDVETIREQQVRLRVVAERLDDPGVKLRHNLGDLRGMLLMYDGDDREALAIYEHQVAFAAEAGYHLGSVFSRIEIPILLLRLGRATDALASARANVEYCRATDVPAYIANEAESYIGVCLTATGDPAAGLDHLQRLVSVSPFGTARPAINFYWLHLAASELGQDELARSTLVRARRYIQAFRSDLTNTQWQTASTRKPELVALLNLIGQDD